MANIDAYFKSANSGYLKWEVIEANFNSVDHEESVRGKRIANIRRIGDNNFIADVDNLENEPIYDEKDFTSRRSARKWCERLIKKDEKTSKTNIK